MRANIFSLLMASLVTNQLFAEETVRRFDFGPSVSTVAPRHIAVTPETRYEAARGWGFTEPPEIAEIIDDRWTAMDKLKNQEWRVIDGFVDLDERTGDYVAGKRFQFRVDLLDGDYDVVATLGNRSGLHYLRVSANGKIVADDISVFTYHYAGRGQRDDCTIGGVYHARFPVTVKGGRLELTFSGNPEGKTREHLLKGPQGREITFETRAPYERNSLMSLTILPRSRLPISYQSGRLVVETSAASVVRRAAEAVNARSFALARELAAEIDDEIAKAYVWMSLAGHPDIDADDEALAIGRAVEILRKRLDDPHAENLLEQAELFQQAVRHFYDRRTGNTEIRMIGNLHKAHSIWRQFGDDHPFHYKGLIYSARAFKGMVPFSLTPKSEYGLELFREVESKFADNKYVRLFLHDEWSESDWKFNAYPAPPGTPKWAETIRRAYSQALDFGEWWADHRQLEDGSLGGGWNDDVEVMPLFALAGWVSPDASPRIGEMVERFTEGLWSSENIDRRRSFSAEFFDAEHAAEDQGNSLPYLTAVFYGNPRYLHWNINTLQHFRNFLTGVNDKGHRHFRSHHFGSTRYSLDLSPGHVSDDVEAAICYRAFGPAPWLHWYNGNPIAKKMLVEHADSWLMAAMSEDKGKPKGIIPSQLGFHGEIGGSSRDWRGKAQLGGGGVWPDYNVYLQNLFLSTYRATRDEKYLAPFKAALDWLNGFRDDAAKYTPRDDAPDGSPAWIYNTCVKTSLFSDAFFAIRDMTGDHRYDQYIQQCGSPYLRYRLSGNREILVEDIESINARVRERWPHMTTDAVMTDRIGYAPQMISYMVGAPVLQGFQGFPNHAVTYTNTMRDFATLVDEASDSKLRLSYYSFWETSRAIGIRPWKLRPGGRYRLRAVAVGGQELSAQEFTLTERGQPLTVVIPPLQEVSIEIQASEGISNTYQHLADLALSKHDLHWNADTDLLEVTIHNVGATDANNVEVAFYHQVGLQRSLLEKAVITRIGAPNELQAENVTIGSWGHRNLMREGDDVLVVIDPDRKISEITRTNNEGLFRLQLTHDKRQRMLTKRLTTPDRRGLLRNITQTEPLESNRPKIHFLKDLVYGKDDPRMQRLDAYLIQSKSPTAAVIEFHGGGWRRGQKSDLAQYDGFPRMLIEKGVSYISVDYRLTPKAVWPAQGDDARLAVQYVLANAKRWNIDPQRLALLGGSAGAHLALWVGFQPDIDVAAIIDLWGPSDLAIANVRIPRGDAFTALFGCTFDEFAMPGTELAQKIHHASPVNHVTNSAPPVFIVHDGPADAVSPNDPRISGANMGPHSAAYGLHLSKKLEGVGVEHKLLIAPRAGVEFQPQAWKFLMQKLSLVE